jgi:hypothetical protein
MLAAPVHWGTGSSQRAAREGQVAGQYPLHSDSTQTGIESIRTHSACWLHTGSCIRQNTTPHDNSPTSRHDSPPPPHHHPLQHVSSVSTLTSSTVAPAAAAALAAAKLTASGTSRWSISTPTPDSRPIGSTSPCRHNNSHNAVQHQQQNIMILYACTAN